MTTYDRILGAFYGAAIGDAMGAATETMTPTMIVERYGKYLDEIVPAGKGTFACGSPAGFVTDDFSLAYFTARAILDFKGTVNQKMAEQALLTWFDHKEYSRFVGPSTSAAISAIRGEEQPVQVETACNNSKASNGSAMKIFPAGVMNPGKPEEAVKTAVTICKPTHDNTAALSAAGAIAAAVSVAMEGATLDQVIEAGFQGARLGAQFGKPVSSASVERRMELAVEIGKRNLGWEKTMLELGDVVGSGLYANEAVPCVFGILAACGDDPMAAIGMGVNVGDDTDTVATMVGAIVGAMYGIDALPKKMRQQVDESNKFDLAGTAMGFEKLFYA